MELKKYQKNVIQDLSRYLELLLEKQSAGTAYTALWNEKNVMVGLNGMPNYNDVLKGVLTYVSKYLRVAARPSLRATPLSQFSIRCPICAQRLSFGSCRPMQFCRKH